MNRHVRREIHEKMNFVFMFRRRQPVQGIAIGPVHRKDQIEFLKIGRCDAPRAQIANINAAHEHFVLSATVGRIADMPAAAPG